MLKKTPHKRKVKNILRQIIFSFIIFLTTFISLFVFYVIFYAGRHQLLKPQAVLGTKLFQTSSSDEFTQKAEDLLKKNGIQTVTVSPAENNATLALLNGEEEVIFDNNKNLEQQIASLQLIMRHLTIEGKRFSRIDFRFDNPVVTY